MDTKTLLNPLRNERYELDVVIRFLERISNGRGGMSGGGKKETAGAETGHGMSAEAKAKISRALKARWAAKKKSAKKA